MLKRVENLGMMTKVFIPTAVMLLVALGIVALAERSLSKLTAQTHQIIKVTATRQALALAATAAVNSAAANEKNAMLMADKTGMDAFASAYVTDIDHLKDAVARLKALAMDPGEAGRLDQIGGAIAAYYATGEQLYQFMVDREFDKAHALSTGGAQNARERLMRSIGEEVEETAADMRQADGQADTLYKRTVGFLAALSVGGLFAALLMVSWISTRFIVGPLARITKSMGRISGGDLAIEIEDAGRRDEIGVLGRALSVFRERSLALRENTRSLKTAHDEIRVLNGTLERRVEERTAELKDAHRELLAKERLSSLGQLTASVAHELRNPLSTLRNTMHALDQMVRARGIDAERQLGRCRRTIDRCDGIITDLLDFAGARELRASAMHLDAWLGEVLDRIELPPGIVLERQLDAPRAVAQIDGERLGCAIGNVIENAVEAVADSLDPARRRIIVSTHAGDRAEIVIADTGPGMSDEVLGRVFEPLFSTRSFGTGLGLPTVKQIVEQHGGDIAIGSAPGAGTRVQLRLPLQAAKRGQAAA
jgi:signal transduction histidine kinase